MYKTILDDKELDEYNKEYSDQRKLDRKAYQKIYRDANKEYHKKWREEHRAELIQYRIDRKDIIDLYNKKYYQKGIENNPDKYKEKAECIYCKKTEIDSTCLGTTKAVNPNQKNDQNIIGDKWLDLLFLFLDLYFF